MGNHPSHPTSSPKAHGIQGAPGPEGSLYERLGGIFNIAAVVDRFSDQILLSALVGTNSENPFLRQWATHSKQRLPGLKWMRTLWVADVSGGPYKFVPTRPGHNRLALENAHRNLRISPEEFDEVAYILADTLDYFHVPEKEKNEVLSAFMAHKGEVTDGFFEFINKGYPIM